MIRSMRKTNGAMQATIVKSEPSNHTLLEIQQEKAINVLPGTTARSNHLHQFPACQAFLRLVIAPISVRFVLLVSTVQGQLLIQSSVLQATVQFNHLHRSSALMAHMLMQRLKDYLIKTGAQFVQTPNGVVQVQFKDSVVQDIGATMERLLQITLQTNVK